MISSVTLRFYQFRVPIIGWLIQLFTRHWTNHVDLVLDNGDVISALPPFGVQRWPQSVLIGAGRHHDITLPCTEAQRAHVLDFATRQVGKPYDYAGLFLFTLRPSWNDPSRWFCSELCAAALIDAGIIAYPGRIARVSPGRLFKWCSRSLAQ